MKFLQSRTWRELRALARAYGLHFDNNAIKIETQRTLSEALLAGGGLRRALAHLNKEEHTALMALKAGENRIDKARFCRAYGPIRPYRPWLPDAPLHPWRHPVSVAEKLWFLGLIEVDAHRAIRLPAEVAALLPAVPRRETAIWPGAVPQLQPAAVVRDVAALLGTLLHIRTRLVHGRWLPPYALKAINQRVSQPENLVGVRSEFQCQRTRFLHYLAQAAGLLTVQNGVLLPSAQAWEWLAWPYDQAHRCLMTAVRADLQLPQPLWERFKLPEVGAPVWEYLIALPAGTYTIGSLSAELSLKTLDLHAGTHIRAALLGPLCWLGLGVLKSNCVRLACPTFPATTPACLHPTSDAIAITLAPAPPLRALTELLAWASVDTCGLWIDAASAARLVAHGHDADHLARILVELSGAPLPTRLRHQIEGWLREASRVQIRPTRLLTVTAHADMQAIRADWRLRPLLGRQISPQHIEVRDERALRQHLSRRGYTLAEAEADGLPRTNNVDPAYVWLAVRICQSLGQMVSAPITIPGAVAAELEPQLADRLDLLRGMVTSYVEQLQAALRGRLENRPLLDQPDPTRIRRAVEQTLNAGAALRIRYFSPAAGIETERTIEPQVIYERQGATYIEAWCSLDDAQRTFRLDRIRALV